MDKKPIIQFPTFSEIDNASKEYSSYETKHLYIEKGVKKTEIERNFKYAVDWVINYIKTKNT